MIVNGVNYFQLFTKEKVVQKESEVSLDSTEELMNKMKRMLDEDIKRQSETVKEEPSASLKLPPVVSKTKLPPVVDSKKSKEIEKVEKENALSEIKDYQKSLEKVDKTTVVTKKKVIKYTGKPKIAIVIDDVAFAHQVKGIQKIPYKVTPSFSLLQKDILIL